MPDDSTVAAPAMTYEFIAFDRHDAIAILRLDRPDNLNAWNLQMREELRDAVRACVDDDDLRVLIITGTGRAKHGIAESMGQYIGIRVPLQSFFMRDLFPA